MRKSSKLFLIFTSFFCLQAFSVTSELTVGFSGYVNEVIDGSTLILNGKKVRLAGIKTTKSKKELSRLMEGHKATLWFNEIKKDRYGRFTGHLIRDDGKWIQKELLLSGMARVFNIANNRKLAKEMLEAEKTARKNHKSKYLIISDKQAEQHIGSFQIIEGRVFSVKKTKNKVWINFDKNWKTDFTILVEKNVNRMFEKSGIELETMKGQLIRVRGWIEKYNGAMIKLTCPEQIEHNFF